MFCHQCGTASDDPDARFCYRCGAPLRRGEETVAPPPGPASPLAEPSTDRRRRPISAWPDPHRERIQLPLTELRQRRSRDAGEAPPVPPPAQRPVEPPPPAVAAAAAPAVTPVDDGLEIETVGPDVEPDEEPSSSRSRAEEALRRMVPPKEEWVAENSPGPAERTTVRDEWPAAGLREETPPPPPPVAAPVALAAAPAPEPASAPPAEDAIIPWLEPPLVAVPVERPVPPSREAKDEVGPIIVPRDYDEKTGRRKGRRPSRRGRGPLVDPAALGRSIKPSWILAIAGVILLTLIVFAIFPPGGGSSAGPDKVNRFTGMPVHTIATPARPTAGTPAATVGAEASLTIAPIVTETAPTPVPTSTRWSSAFGLLPGTSARATTAPPVATSSGSASTSGVMVVISSPGGWSGTIGEMAGTYTETPVVGNGTQNRVITGPVTMVTVNIQKLDQTADPLEVRVERDGAVLKSGRTTEPAGIVALSVQV
jgi:hypothetical protein